MIRIPAPPGAWLTAEVELETGTGRRYTFKARARAEEDGFIRLRVPYATLPGQPVRALGPDRLTLGEAGCDVAVSEESVRSGATVEVASCGEAVRLPPQPNRAE